MAWNVFEKLFVKRRVVKGQGIPKATDESAVNDKKMSKDDELAECCGGEHKCGCHE